MSMLLFEPGDKVKARHLLHSTFTYVGPHPNDANLAVCAGDTHAFAISFDDIYSAKEPLRVEGWVNVYRTSIPFCKPILYKDKKHADADADLWGAANRIACVYVSGSEDRVPGSYNV